MKKQRTNHLKPLLKWVIVPYVLATLFIVRGYIQTDSSVQQRDPSEANVIEAMGNNEGFKDLILDGGTYKLVINNLQRISDDKIKISFLLDNHSNTKFILGWRGEFFIEDIDGKMHKYRVNEVKVPPQTTGHEHAYVLKYSLPVSSISKVYTMQSGIHNDHLIYWENQE